MAEANKEPQFSTTESLIQDLKSCFLEYEINPASLADYVDCFTAHDKDEIRRVQDLQLAIDAFFNRLVIRPVWLYSLVRGITDTANRKIIPLYVYGTLSNIFCTVEIQIEPGYIIDETGKTCISGTNCSPVLSRRQLLVQESERSYTVPKKAVSFLDSVQDQEGSSTDPKTLASASDLEGLEFDIKSKYSVFKECLMEVEGITDKLHQEGILSVYEIQDIQHTKHMRHKIDYLLKKLLMEKGTEGCRMFLKVISEEECGSQNFIIRTPSRLQLIPGKINSAKEEVTQIKLIYSSDDVLKYMPNVEELIDLMVETDAYSVHEHDEVFRTRTRREQVKVFIGQLTTEHKIDVFLQVVHVLGCEALLKYLLPNASGFTKEYSLQTEGSSMLMETDDDHNSNIDFRLQIESEDKQSIENRIKEQVPSSAIDTLADKLAKLSIYDVGSGSVIIEFKPESASSIAMLRQAYLDGTLNEVIKEMFTRMGIKEFEARGKLEIQIEIGFTKDRESRTNAKKTEHAELLRLNQAFLLEELDPFPVLQAMRTHELLTDQQINWLLSKEPRTRKTRVQEILNLLKWMDSASFEVFMNSLKESSQHYIYQHLRRPCYPEVIRKMIRENGEKIAAELDINMLRELCRRCLYHPSKQIFSLADTKHQILNHILRSSNEIVLNFEDVINAAGRGYLLRDHDETEEPRTRRTEMYKQIFEELLEDTKEMIKKKENMGNVLSVEYKDDILFFKIQPSNMLELKAIGELENRSQYGILHIGEELSVSIQQMGEKHGICIRDIGLQFRKNQWAYELCRTWLINKSPGQLDDPSQRLELFKQHPQKLSSTLAALFEDPVMATEKIREFVDSKNKLEWIRNVLDRYICNNFETEIGKELANIANFIYRCCSTNFDTTFSVSKDETSQKVIISHDFFEEKVQLHKDIWNVFLSKKVFSPSHKESKFEFSSKLLCDYLITKEESFLTTEMFRFQIGDTFPYLVMFRPREYLQSQKRKEESNILRYKCTQAVMMLHLDNKLGDTDLEMFADLMCKDWILTHLGYLPCFELLYVIEILKERRLLKGVEIPVVGRMTDKDEQHTNEETSLVLYLNEYLPKGTFEASRHTFQKMLHFASALWNDFTITVQNLQSDRVTFILERLSDADLKGCVLDMSPISFDNHWTEELRNAVFLTHCLCHFKTESTGSPDSHGKIFQCVSGQHISHVSLNGITLHLSKGPGTLGLINIPNLEILEMNQCSLSDKDIEIISLELSFLKRLVEVDFGNNQFSVNGLKKLRESLKSAEGIRALRLQRNEIGPDDEEELSHMLLQMPNIEILNVSGCKIGDKGIASIAEVLAQKSIRKLNVRENNITMTGSKSLFVALKKKSRVLQHLDFSWNEIGSRIQSGVESKKMGLPVSADAALEFLSLLKVEPPVNPPCWDYLCLWNCGLGYTSVFQNSEELGLLEGLTSLCLQDNSLNNRFAEALGLCMKTTLTSLRHLNLRKNCISDSGAVALVDGLRANRFLEEVYIDRNQIRSAEILIAVYESLTTSEHRNMQTLDLSLNELPDGGEYYTLKTHLTEGVELKNIVRDGRILTVTKGSLQLCF